jgi:predicted RecB family endonuclease
MRIRKSFASKAETEKALEELKARIDRLKRTEYEWDKFENYREYVRIINSKIVEVQMMKLRIEYELNNLWK